MSTDFIGKANSPGFLEIFIQYSQVKIIIKGIADKKLTRLPPATQKDDRSPLSPRDNILQTIKKPPGLPAATHAKRTP
jgi:hypothetical protein